LLKTGVSVFVSSFVLHPLTGLVTKFQTELIWLAHPLYYYLNLGWRRRCTVSLVMVSAAITVVQQFRKSLSCTVSNGRSTPWHWLWRQSGVLASQVTLATCESIRLKQTKYLLTQMWEHATRHWMKTSPYFFLQHTFIIEYCSYRIVDYCSYRIVDYCSYHNRGYYFKPRS